MSDRRSGGRAGPDSASESPRWLEQLISTRDGDEACTEAQQSLIHPM
jgi:hypothetical protein